jgi:2-keto-4-pentenoate hydratase/2-oxohepta-3-ene-1,7-dioic acid hydratase in catechol pathway
MQPAPVRLLVALYPAHFTQGQIWPKVNGVIKQDADLKQMIWSVVEQISKLSETLADT